MIFFDTNILIAHQYGFSCATQAILEADDRGISVIVEMEFMCGFDEQTQQRGRQLLDQFKIIGLTPDIVDYTIALRRAQRFKLPDAIIYATAKLHGSKLITCNHKDFDANDPIIHIHPMTK